MKKWIILAGVMAFLVNWGAYAQNGHRNDGQNDNSGKTNENDKPNNNWTEKNNQPSNENHQPPTRNNQVNNQSPQIDLSHKPFHNNVGNTEPNRTTHWSNPSNNQTQQQYTNPNTNTKPQENNFTKPSESTRPNQDKKSPWKTIERPNTSKFVSVKPTGSNVAHHHHPYTQGYVRKKLQKIGIKNIPGYIKDRRGILDADKSHSTIHFPQRGPKNQPLGAKVLPIKEFKNTVVSNRMTFLHSDAFAPQIAHLTSSETQRDHYFWHSGNGFQYCHYVDDWGYHWYGWYEGDNCFWVRYYGDRWWCYDDDSSRWCFWDNDQWWWQDPNHVGDLYLYNDGQYIAADSANDPVVNTIQVGSETTYKSPDGTRLVKVMVNGGDAFLFDTAIPPSFNPIYMASNVTDVKYSNTSDGSPLEVMLTLNDGTFDLFDDQGNPLNFSDDTQNDPSTDNTQGN